MSEDQGKDISYAALYKTQAHDDEDQSTNQIEKIIAHALENRLNVPITNMKSNIFDLGAHSLMIADFCSELNSILSNVKKISILDIFTYPTIHTLAKHISLKQGSSAILNEKTSFSNYQQTRLIKKKLHDNVY